MFAIILVIHPSLSLNISQKLSNLHLYSDILRGGFCFQLDRLHRKSVHYILTSRFFVFEGQLWVAFPYGFFIHESLAFWTNLNSIMFRVFIVRFNQSFWLKLYFLRPFFFETTNTRFWCVDVLFSNCASLSFRTLTCCFTWKEGYLFLQPPYWAIQFPIHFSIVISYAVFYLYRFCSDYNSSELLNVAGSHSCEEMSPSDPFLEDFYWENLSKSSSPSGLESQRRWINLQRTHIENMYSFLYLFTTTLIDC